MSFSGTKGWNTKPKPGVQINPLHPLSKGLVGYWLFNEGAGSKVNDISGKNNHGILTNIPPNVQGSGWGGSKFGGGLQFDGANDYVNVPDSPLWAMGTKDFTIGILTKLDTLAQDDWWTAAFVSHSEGGGLKNKWYFSYDDITDKLLIHINSPAGENIIIRSDVLSLSAKVDYHLTLVRNNNDWNFYKNGIAIGTTNQAATLHNAFAPLIFGWGEGVGGFDGSIDFIYFYDHAKSPTEIKQLHLNPFCNLLQVPIRRYSIPVVSVSPTGVFYGPLIGPFGGPI